MMVFLKAFVRKLVILTLLTAIVFGTRACSHRRTSGQRMSMQCTNVRKAIAAAIELYNLDKNAKRTTIDAAFLEDLRAAGYLDRVPNHPGMGKGSWSNWEWVGGRAKIRCKLHPLT